MIAQIIKGMIKKERLGKNMKRINNESGGK